MLNHNKVAIKNCPRGINCYLVWTCEDDNPLPRRMDRSPQLVDKLHAAMRVARPVACRRERIRSLHRIIRRRVDRSLEEEMSIGNAEIGGEGIAGNWSRCLC